MRLLPLAFAGCTFIAGPPDTSNVASPLGDPTLDVDALGLVYEFTPDESFDEGVLRIRLPDETVELNVPDDVPGWDPGTPYTLHITRDWSCDGETLTPDLTAIQPDGFELETYSLSTTMGGAGEQLGGELHALGTLEVPFVVCGDLPNPQDEFDQARLQFATARRVRLDLTWVGETDLDLTLTDDDSNALVEDNTGGSIQPATVDFPVVTNTGYRIEVTHFDGPDTLWKVAVTAAP